MLLYARTGKARHNPYLLDGDVVHVPKPGAEVTIAGPVRDPGRYELVATRDMNELMQLAGGLKSSASRRLPIRVVRRGRHERKTTTALRFTSDGRLPNYPLRDDDEIVIPSTGELERSIALIGAVVGADPADPATTVKRLPYIEGDSVRSLLERAGGVTVSADLKNAYVQRDGNRLYPIDLEALLVRRDFRKDRPVRLGDTSWCHSSAIACSWRVPSSEQGHFSTTRASECASTSRMQAARLAMRRTTTRSG